jgi:hypothetical protein
VIDFGRNHVSFYFVRKRYGINLALINNLIVNAPVYLVMLAFLIPMPSDASKNLPKSEIRQFRTLYLSIVTAGSNPEVSVFGSLEFPSNKTNFV